jgi:acyl-CoA thioesterase
MNQVPLAKRVFEQMFDNDPFSQWLGIQCLKIEAGHCVLRMTVRPEMTNGFSVAHGGIAYSIADSALAFASNSHGKRSVSIETSISHTEPVRSGDVLTATAEEKRCSSKTGIYDITVENQDRLVVALFRGIVYRTSRDWFPS